MVEFNFTLLAIYSLLCIQRQPLVQSGLTKPILNWYQTHVTLHTLQSTGYRAGSPSKTNSRVRWFLQLTLFGLVVFQNSLVKGWFKEMNQTHVGVTAWHNFCSQFFLIAPNIFISSQTFHKSISRRNALYSVPLYFATTTWGVTALTVSYDGRSKAPQHRGGGRLW